MQFLLDHIAAVVISGIILLVIIATQYRGQQTNIDATQFYDSRIRLLDMVQSVERDFTNMGSGVDSVQYAISSFDTLSSPATISFFARTDSTDFNPHTVTYQWESTDSLTLKDKTKIPTYTVKRLIDGNMSGQSVGAITGFRVDLLTRDSLAVNANFKDVRFVNVLLRVASTLGTNAQVEETNWRKQFRPMNMTREQE
jgi:hypothetical protein